MLEIYKYCLIAILNLNALERSDDLRDTISLNHRINTDQSADDSSHYYTKQNMINMKSFYAMK